MHALADAASWVRLASGILIIVLGTFVLFLRPERGANRAFALFAAGWGGQFVAVNAGTLFLDEGVLDPSPVLGYARAFLNLAAVVGLAGVAFSFPTALRRVERRFLVLPAAGAVAGLAAGDALLVASETPQALVHLLTNRLLWGVLGSLPAFFALRAASTSDPDEQRRYALLAGALVLYSGFISTAGGSGERPYTIYDPAWTPALVVLLAFTLLASALWLRVASRGGATRVARNAALLCAAMPFVGLALLAAELARGALGVLRIAAVAVLAYGVVRHQLLGIDVKVRWTISRGTVAAAFVAVFFVASEAAQLLFGAGNAWVGLAGAGMLVFALAPLQRAAERLAERAVPSDVAPATPRPGKEDAYCTALRMALRAGAPSPEDEIGLAHLSDELGLTHRRAVELRRDVERELRGEGAVSRPQP